MAKKSKRLRVEDHEYGYMVIGDGKKLLTIKRAKKAMREYLEDPEELRFAHPTFYAGRSAVWLTWLVGALPVGASCSSGHEYTRMKNGFWRCLVCRPVPARARQDSTTTKRSKKGKAR